MGIFSLEVIILDIDISREDIEISRRNTFTNCEINTAYNIALGDIFCPKNTGRSAPSVALKYFKKDYVILTNIL